MKRLTLCTFLAAAALCFGPTTVSLAAPAAKPLMSGMVQENGEAVQHVRDALTAFSGIHKHWPGGLDELAVFAVKNGMPLDLKPFKKMKYFTQDRKGTSVAVFEFELGGSPPVKGAFAMSNFIVK
jgi:hypothetical protein